MNISMNKKIITALAVGLTVASVSLAMPVFAESEHDAGSSMASSTKQTKQQKNAADKLSKAQSKADKAIQDRVESLTKLISRIQAMKNIPDAQKTSISSTIQGLIAHMNTLQAEIDSTASTSVVKNDTAAMKQDYRIYALAKPQLSIVAASDRIITIVNMLAVVGTKLQTRLAADASLTNSAALTTDMTDMSAKINDARIQAQAAFNEVSGLAPDGGDKTKMAANTAALKEARSKIKVAQKDLDAATKDAKNIIKALKKADDDMLKMPKDGGGTNTGTTTGTTGTTSSSTNP